MRILIINGKVTYNGIVERTNVLIDEGIVLSTKAAADIEADKVIDAGGLYVLPVL